MLRASKNALRPGSKRKSEDVPKITSTKSPERIARQIPMEADPTDWHSGQGAMTIPIPRGIASRRITRTSVRIPSVFATAATLSRVWSTCWRAALSSPPGSRLERTNGVARPQQVTADRRVPDSVPARGPLTGAPILFSAALSREYMGRVGRLAASSPPKGENDGGGGNARLRCVWST